MRAIACIGQGVGNVVMATPMIAALAAKYGPVDVLCVSPGAVLLDGWEAVGRLYTTPSGVAVNGVVYDLAVRGVWCPIHWPPVEVRALDYVSPDRADMRRSHESTANMTVPRKLGYDGPTPAPHVEADAPRDLAEMDVCLCPGIGGDGAFWDRKLWPHWPALTVALHAKGLSVGCLGAARDRELDVGNVDYDLRGDTTLRQAAGILAASGRAVCVDNGLAHVAGAVGAETHVVFGFTSWVKNRPLGKRVTVHAARMPCQPCQMTPLERECQDPACIRAVTPGEIVNAMGVD